MAYMDHINRYKVGGNNADILDQFNWDLIILSTPKAVYWPGNELFKSRLKKIGGLPSEISVEVNEVEGPGGFKILAPGDNTSGNLVSITLDFLDYEDCSIAFFGKDWSDKCQDPITKISRPKAELVMDIQVLQLNNARKPVKQWTLYNGIIESINTNESFDSKKNPNGAVSINIKFEWYKIEYLNK